MGFLRLEVIEQQQNLYYRTFWIILNLIFIPKKFLFSHSKGEIKILPVGSTALDFAFFSSTDLGMKMFRRKNQWKTGSYFYVLQNGDQIDILSSQNQNQSKIG